MPQYSRAYLSACNHLIEHGAHGGNLQAGRDLIARALRDLRAQHGRDRAASERRHLQQIAGCFPVKPGACGCIVELTGCLCKV